MENFSKINAVLTAEKIYFDAKKASKLTSAQILKSWDYKKDGLKINDVRAQIVEVAKFQHAKESREFDERYQKALPISTYSNYAYGRYDCPSRNFKLSPNVLASVTWGEETDWNYYSKSYGRPKNTYSNRCVIFRTFDRVSGTTETKTFDLETFAGQFMERALAWFFGSATVKVSKDLKAVQLNPIFTVNFVRSIGGVSVYYRSIGGVIWDYCVINKGVTFHAITIEKAIDGLREKAEKAAKIEAQRIEDEGRVLDYNTAINQYGFCATGIRNFCDLNGLNVDSQYSIREIRKAVVPNRSENCARFAAELKQIGIALNCA